MKTYLGQIRKLDTQIKNKLIEYQRLEGRELFGTEHLERIRELQRMRAEIIESIERLPEAEYDVLHKVYVQYETLQEVAAERGISYSLASTIHGRALKHLGAILATK